MSPPRHRQRVVLPDPPDEVVAEPVLPPVTDEGEPEFHDDEPRPELDGAPLEELMRLEEMMAELDLEKEAEPEEPQFPPSLRDPRSALEGKFLELYHSGRPGDVWLSTKIVDQSFIVREDTPVIPDDKEPEPRPRTSQVMMKVQVALKLATGKLWHTLAWLNATTDQPYAPFVLKARMPGENLFFGEFDPPEDAALVDDFVAEIVTDFLAFRADLEQQPVPVAAVPLTLPTGEPIQVITKAKNDHESALDHERRAEKIIELFGDTLFITEGGGEVTWNGMTFAIYPGENHLPQPVIDIYLESRKLNQKAHERMSQVLNDSANRRFIAEDTYVASHHQGQRVR